MLETNKNTVRKLYLDCITAGRLELLDELVAADYLGIHDEVGSTGFRTTIVGLRTAFPDIRYTIEDLIAEGDRVTVRWRWDGHHRAAFRGFPASGKLISDTGIAIYQLRNGQIVRSWLETNRLGFLQQIGVVPSAAQLGLRA